MADRKPRKKRTEKPVKDALTTPKPFVFVLMPFDEKFSDIYKFGIKGAADDAGAYAERLDEQMFAEGMLQRIFNQISKADVDEATRPAPRTHGEIRGRRCPLGGPAG